MGIRAAKKRSGLERRIDETPIMADELVESWTPEQMRNGMTAKYK